MLQEISELIGLSVYTRAGVFIGNVDNLVLDVEQRKVESLFLATTNPVLVEDSKAVSVPFRWIQAVGDIVVLKHFPHRVTSKRAGDSEE